MELSGRAGKDPKILGILRIKTICLTTLWNEERFIIQENSASLRYSQTTLNGHILVLDKGKQGSK